MKDIAIYGAGGFGKEVACLIKQINESSHTDWNLIGFFDDGKDKGSKVSHYGNVLGNIDDLNCYKSRIAIVLAMGNPQYMKHIRESITNENVYFPNLIAPDFGISDKETFSIGEGNIIGWRCSVSCDVNIDSYNIINSDIIFGHDSKVGKYNIIMPGVRISGEVSIGDCNLLGVGSIVLQQIRIGNNVRLGAGAVLMKKPKDGELYLGNPAKLFKY